MVSVLSGLEGRPLEPCPLECFLNLSARLKNYMEEGKSDRARTWVWPSESRRSVKSSHLAPQIVVPVKFLCFQ